MSQTSVSANAPSTPSTIAMLEQAQAKRRADSQAAVAAFMERSRNVRRQLVIRSGVGYEELVTTYRTLRQLGGIDLEDLVVPPGFNLLPDGEVGSANTDTPEWQLWSDLKAVAERAKWVGDDLSNAADELRVAGHWAEAVSA